jgi:hypothetical protein
MDCIRIRPAMGNWPEAPSSLLAAPVASQMSAPEARRIGASISKIGPISRLSAQRCSARG